MLRTFVRTIRNLDYPMLGAMLVLLGIGLAALGGLTLAAPAARAVFWKQTGALGLGLGLFLIMSMLDYRALRQYRTAFGIVGIALLLLVLFFGTTIRGTTGWFRIGAVSFQPVELVKVFLVIQLAGGLAAHAYDRSLRTLLGTSWLAALSVALILAQPDFGSVVILLIYWFLMLVLSGMPRRQVVGIVLLVAAAAAVSWWLVFKPYQQERILTFLDPSRDPRGRGYNLIQSVITVGSGGLMGRGLGQGTQSQLRFLPEGQTDFIFAVIAEELGFLAVVAVLGLFAFIFYRGIKLTMRARDDFTVLLGYGIVFLIALEVIVNIGMNLGLLPVTGIALPLLSAGGSSLVSTLMLFGILQSIAVRQKIEAYKA